MATIGFDTSRSKNKVLTAERRMIRFSFCWFQTDVAQRRIGCLWHWLATNPLLCKSSQLGCAVKSSDSPCSYASTQPSLELGCRLDSFGQIFTDSSIVGFKRFIVGVGRQRTLTFDPRSLIVRSSTDQRLILSCVAALIARYSCFDLGIGRVTSTRVYPESSEQHPCSLRLVGILSGLATSGCSSAAWIDSPRTT